MANKRVACDRQRCKRRAYRNGLCKTHFKQHLDQEFAKEIRAVGICRAKDTDPVRCDGNLQCAHIISRSYLRTRWDGENAIALCAAHHTYYTHRPQEWIEWCRSNGIDWDALHRRALGLDP